MYHPSRGGVRGGRDQFNWDDVKSDKHRENYLGHSVKAPVGRWQKGKDLMWYARDGKQTAAEAAASAREEIEHVKQEEEEAMREALGLAPKRDNKPRGNRLDKREQEELFKRTKAGEEVEKPYAEGERIQGLGFAPAPKTEVPDKKELLQPEVGAAEGGPLAQIVAHSHKIQQEREEQIPVAAAQEEGSPGVSDEHAKKRKRKEDKRAAKEKRREEKRAAKQARRERRKQRHSSTSSDEEPTKLVNREGSPARGPSGKADRTERRHDSDRSDEEHGQHALEKHDTYGDDEDTRGRPKDLIREKLQRSRRRHGSYSSDDEDPKLGRKNHTTFGDERTRGRASPPKDVGWQGDQRSRQGDESGEDVRGRPAMSRLITGQKGERSGSRYRRDARKGYDVNDELSDDDARQRPSGSKDRNGEDHRRSRGGNEILRSDEGDKGRGPSSRRKEREREYDGARGRESSPRRRHGSDDGEANGRRASSYREDREGRYGGARKGKRTSPRQRYDLDDGEDNVSLRERGNGSSRMQERGDEFSRRDGGDLSRDDRGHTAHRRHSRSPVRRKEASAPVSRKRRHDSDSD